MAKTMICCVVLAVAVPLMAAPRLSLRATSDSQIIQNQQADADRLGRLPDEVMVARYVRLKLLEPVAARTRSYYVHKVPAERRYLRPWSKLFLNRLSAQFRRRFGRPLRVTSLVRTVAYQERLRRRNRNAASPRGEKRSTHLTGACLDVSKKGMRGAEVAWMRRVLYSLKQKGYLYPVEEFQQPNFHVMVYRDYPEYVEQLAAKRSSR